MKIAGISQALPSASPIVMEIGTCSHSTTARVLLVVWRSASRPSFSTIIPLSPNLSAKTCRHRLRVQDEPGAGRTEAGQSVMVIRANDEQGRQGRKPDDGRLRGPRSVKYLLRAPPRRKRNRDDRRVRTNL